MVWKLSSFRSKYSILKSHSHIPGELYADNRPAMRNVFPSPSSSRTSYCLCPVDIRLYRSGILNRPTGNAVAEYASNFLFSPFILVDHRMLPSKTDDSDLSEGSRLRFETLAMGWWPRASFMVFAECQISGSEGINWILHHSSSYLGCLFSSG